MSDATSPVTAPRERAGARLRDLRLSLGMSQDDLARKTGLSRSTIAGVETGYDRAGLETLVVLADFFAVPIDYLIQRTPPAQGHGELLAAYTEAPSEVELIRFWRRLDPPERNVLVRMLETPPPDRNKPRPPAPRPGPRGSRTAKA